MNDFKAQFQAQRSMPKKEVMKLKAGTWIELKWEDSPNEVALLLEKPENESGDVSILVYHPETRSSDRHAVHSQVVAMRGILEVPNLLTQC